ncbi:MAG: phage tail tape measure protein, partial [Candidatus Omnitrophota bacterium]
MFIKAGKSMVDVGKTLTTAITLPIIAIGAATGKMAMEAIESENLFEVSMGDMAGAARKWSEDLRANLGLNEYEVRKNVATFNVMFDSMGMGTKASYDMATGLTQLSYDMSSFYNLKPEEAFQKLQAGISGEVEPLKRLGIVVNETTVKTYALKNGIAKQGQELNEQQKILARYGVIMEATKKAQGDLARTIDSPTNQLRIMKQEAQQLGIEFGMSLIPIIQQAIIAIKPMVETIKGWVQGFKNLSPETQQMIIKIALFAAAIGPAIMIVGKISGGFGTLVKGIGGAIGVFGKFAAVLGLSSPVLLLIIAVVAALAAAAYLLIKNWDKVPPFFTSMWTVIKYAFFTAMTGINLAFKGTGLAIAKVLDFVVGGVAGVLSGLMGMLSKIPYIGDAFKGVQEKVDGFRSGLKNMVTNAEKDLSDAKSYTTIMASETKKAWGTMAQAASELGKGMGNTIKDTFTGIKNKFEGGASDIKATAPEYATSGEVVADALGDGIELGAKKSAEDLAKQAKEAYEKLKGELDSFGAAITKALRKRYDAQEKIETDALDDSLDREKTAHDEKLKLYDAEYKAKLKALNAGKESALSGLQTQIDAINNMTDAENKALEEQEYQQKIADLREQILQAESNEDKIGLQEELDKEIADHERDALLDSRQAQIKLLEQQMENIREKAENEEEALQESYDLQKEAVDAEYDLLIEGLNNEKDALKEHYQALADEEALQAEARKLVISKDQDAIIKLLNTYAPGWQDAGLSFGESLINGLNSAKQSVKAAVSGLLGSVSGGGSTGGGGGSSGGGWNEPTATISEEQIGIASKMQENS